MPRSSSGLSSGCTARRTSRGRASGSLPCNASCTVTGGGCGPRGCWERAPPSSSPSTNEGAPEQQKERLEGRFYLPTRKDCYEDEETLYSMPVITLGREAIRSVRSRPVTPLYHNMSL